MAWDADKHANVFHDSTNYTLYFNFNPQIISELGNYRVSTNLPRTLKAVSAKFFTHDKMPRTVASQARYCDCVPRKSRLKRRSARMNLSFYIRHNLEARIGASLPENTTSQLVGDRERLVSGSLSMSWLPLISYKPRAMGSYRALARCLFE